MADPRIKPIKIKTGVVKRLAKDMVSYIKETDREKQRYDELQAKGGDQHQLKKQTEVINETKAMVPDTKSRLVKARDELAAMLESEKDLAEGEEYKEAQKQIAEANALIESEAQ